MNLFDDIKYPYQFAGCTVYESGAICNKCGATIPRGIMHFANHWNDCIDGNKTFDALMKAREEKGSELTIDDLDKILP